MREDQGHQVTTGITEQLIQTEKDLRNAEDEMLEFQKRNKSVLSRKRETAPLSIS